MPSQLPRASSRRDAPPNRPARGAGGSRYPSREIEPADGLIYDESRNATRARLPGGRPDVRAASIKALSTLRHVTGKRVRLDGVGALRVDFPDGGTLEIIWLDACTGVPIQEKDGSASATAFEVTRVDAARLPTRVS